MFAYPFYRTMAQQGNGFFTQDGALSPTVTMRGAYMYVIHT